jgi:hypothetical protein
MAFLRMRRGRRRTRPLQEAEAYARCHGDRGNDVKVVRLPPRRFEERLKQREAS